ncbi:MAG: disulfide bond formation protein B [Pseudomonadota bacterium]
MAAPHTNSLLVDGSRQFVWALVLAVGMGGVIATALFFEHGLGYTPCALCLEQREPYYVAIPVALVAAISAWFVWPGCISRGMLAITGLLMTYGLVLAIYHAGVEWQFWAGPTDCAVPTGGAAATDTTSLLNALESTLPPSCDQAAGRFLGLSFAGWNVLTSAAFAFVAFRAAVVGAE